MNGAVDVEEVEMVEFPLMFHMRANAKYRPSAIKLIATLIKSGHLTFYCCLVSHSIFFDDWTCKTSTSN
jgi:hypothetical protein